MNNDPLANALSKTLNAEKVAKKELIIHPLNKTIKKVFTILQENNYVGEINEHTEKQGGYATLNLIGQINKCGAIKPRFSVTKNNYEKFEKRYLPAKDFGIIIVSTPQGIMTHIEAKQKKIGGKLIAYCY